MNQRRGLQYLVMLRIVAVAASMFVWMLSIQFSSAGFSIGNPDYRWIGVGLAMVATVLQLVFNKGMRDNPTLFFIGILAYIYGVTTNFIGIREASFFAGIEQIWARGLAHLLLALVIEILPETLFLWAWLNEEKGLSNFLSSLFAGTKLRFSSPKSQGEELRNAFRRPYNRDQMGGQTQ